MFKIDNKFQNPNISRTIRFTESIYNELSEQAAKHNISFNYLVLQCCRYALDNAEKDEKK